MNLKSSMSNNIARFLTAWTAMIVFLQSTATTLPIDDAYKPFIVAGLGAVAVFFTTLTRGEPPEAFVPKGGKF